MRLGLGIGVPYGSGVLNPDKLSLDLQFATDKTLTARRGPTPTFTRGSGATRVNAAGLIEYAPENLILSSNNIASPAWTKEGGTAASSIETVNGLTASVFNEDSANTNHRFYRVVTGLAGISSTFSVWLKAAGRRYVCVNIGSNGPNAFSKLVLDLVDQVVIVSSAGVTVNIQPEANGWARYSFTYAPRADAGTIPIQSNFSSTALSETGVGLNGAAFYVAGQQYERFPSARAYLLTTTDAAYSPRFDHDTVTLACKGLLIEEQRSNLITNSGTPTSWVFTGTNEGTLTAPDVSSNGLRAGLGTTTLTTSNVTSTSATSYTFSVFIKRDNTNWFRIQLNHATNINQANAWFNLATGTAGTASLGNGTITSISSSITPFANGWYRCTVTGTVPSAATLIGSIISATADNSLSRVAGSIYGIWGGQIEAGAFATSYIPTTAAALSRSADVCSITGADFTSFYNQSEGTLFADVTPQTVDQSAAIVIANTSGSSNQHGIYKINSTLTGIGKRWAARTVVNGSPVTQIVTATDIATARSKLAYAYKLNNFSFASNGGLIGTDADGALPSVTALRIGSRDDGIPLNGHIARIQYFKKRLPDAKLQSLTTP